MSRALCLINTVQNLFTVILYLFLFIVLDFQITFQVKRMRKPKAEISESWTGEEDSTQGDSSATHSVLEISGPTIPSPGPSGTCYIEPNAFFYVQYSAYTTEPF